MEYVVCGGGGAYTNETHSIPRVDLPGVTERDVRLYPLRGDSLAAAERVFPVAGYRGWNRWFSQYWDADDPPLFKSFLRLDVDASTLRLRCFAATGCAEHEADPPVEDEVAIPLA